MLIALVLTDRVDIDNATVYDIVSFGRHPYSNWRGSFRKRMKNKYAKPLKWFI